MSETTDTTATTKEAAAALKITARTLFNWRRDGVIDAIKPNGGAVRFPQSEIQRLLKGEPRGND